MTAAPDYTSKASNLSGTALGQGAALATNPLI